MCGCDEARAGHERIPVPRILLRNGGPAAPKGHRRAMKKIYCVFNQTGESFLGLNISRADTPLSRLRGLLGQFRMKIGEGLWVVPSHGIHTVGLISPVDLVYLDAVHRVIHLVEHLSPFRIAPFRIRSCSVLELPPHTIYSSQTHLGDQLLICPPEEMEGHFKKASAAALPPLEKAQHNWSGM